jgi:hypothetical protein
MTRRRSGAHGHPKVDQDGKGAPRQTAPGRPSDQHLCLEENQTTPRIATADVMLTTKTKKMLGPGSACLASVAVCTMVPFSFFAMA